MSAENIARQLLEIKAVFCRVDEPFTLTSGSLSPVYVDMRRVISFPRTRRLVVEAAAAIIRAQMGPVDVVAGGETAGIPYAAWVADRLDLPMIYVRKQPKGFGRNALIEGQLNAGERVVLVEDLIFDGQSKLRFIEGIQQAGGWCSDVLAVFDYAQGEGNNALLAQAGIKLYALTNWPILLEIAETEGFFTPEATAVIRAFLADPRGWSERRRSSG